MRIYVPRKVKEKGLQGSLMKLADIPQLPAETCRMVEETASRVGNHVVLSYSINASVTAFYGNISAYKMDYEKALTMLRIAIENSCVLHAPELEISATHMESELRRLGIMKKGQSLLEADTEMLELVRSYVRVASFWRNNGGRNSWRSTQDNTIIRGIITSHKDDIQSVLAAIGATRSISAPFVAAMDSLSTPLAQGAL